jgi:general secretion pathway protein D
MTQYKESCVIISLRLKGILAAAIVLMLGAYPAVTSSIGQTTGESSASLPVPQSSKDQEDAVRQLLLKARRSLANGDTEEAERLMEEARAFEVDFTAVGDSPDLVHSMIKRQLQLMELYDQRDPSFNPQAAAFLLLQADGLISYQDFGTAEMLINQAAQFQVTFTAATGTPEQMLEKLKAAREQSVDSAGSKAQVTRLLAEAQLAIDQERWEDAQLLVSRAKQLNVAENEFDANEIRPWQLELRIQNGLGRKKMADTKSFEFDPMSGGGIAQASNLESDAGEGAEVVVLADYDPQTDQTKVIKVAAETLSDANSYGTAEEASRLPRTGLEYYQAGLAALTVNDRAQAIEHFQNAWLNREGMEGSMRQAIKDQLERLAPNSEVLKVAQASQLEEISPQPTTEQRQMFGQLQSEIFRERAAIESLMQTRPREALEKMQSLRARVAQSGLTGENQRPLLAAIDRDIAEMQIIIQKNLPEIMNDEANADALDRVVREQQRRLDVEMQLQKLVDQYNQLINERRFAEAGVIVNQAKDLAPNSELVAVLTEKHRVQANLDRALAIKAMKEQRFLDGLGAADAAAVGWDFDKLVEFPSDFESYLRKGQDRMKNLEASRYNSPEEARIYNALKNTKIQGEFRGSLADAVEQLADQVGLNIIFDEMAMAAEGIEQDRQVNVPIRSPISLKSALEVILSQVGLVYVVENEVIKVTSKDAQRSNVVQRTYYIGDLVMPMNQNPDPTRMRFIQPGGNSMMNQGMFNMGQAADNMLAFAQQMGRDNQSSPFYNMGNYQKTPQAGVPTYTQFGGEGFGGITMMDFFPLINLIQQTINPDSWSENGGAGTMQAFPANLSLIVTQTQEIHDEILDLLKKLRDLNDVQIVIEVRFLTMTDEFFERIGIDFDFSINDNSGLTPAEALADRRPVSGSRVVGWTDANLPTDNLDLRFTQGSFGAAQPIFGATGFSPATGGSFGFAILSDIEVFFLINAAKGDTRTLITQAPTVTMFNGQAASINDGAQRPFVTSVVPIVGDFAVAHQPIITLLPDGTNLNVQAVVSDDRRFVKMNLVPMFSQVTEVTQFTFDGSTTTRRTSDSVLDDLLRRVQPGRPRSDEEFETITTGITIQQPVISFTTVNTVVSVPDGGTVLLGGIKRMQEGRVESGLPMLSSIPYINRLFRNTAIGHRTQNLMMMVTPRIIIQKELEEDQVGLIN